MVKKINQTQQKKKKNKKKKKKRKGNRATANAKGNSMFRKLNKAPNKQLSSGLNFERPIRIGRLSIIVKTPNAIKILAIFPNSTLMRSKPFRMIKIRLIKTK